MSNPYFHFKQFSIYHDRCAMKVGTDGVLLGAWTPLPADGHGLDIGTGTGLLALMAAQRSAGLHLTGIDIDADAVAQARTNILASPFADRICIAHCPMQAFEPQVHLDVILCNPPYFEASLTSPSATRTTARHTTLLPFVELADFAGRWLSDDGFFSVVLPTEAFDGFLRLCFDAGLHLFRRCDVKTTIHKAPKRTLACFCRHGNSQPTETLVLQDGNRRTEAYNALTKDFYL